MPVIKVEHLSKTYAVAKKEQGLKGALRNLFLREKVMIPAVQDINFSIEEGEIVAFIGPNGAGKSTTVKMMSGILTPTSGHVYIHGLDPQQNRIAVVQRLGVVFGQRTQLNWDLRLGESFELMKHIYRIEQAAFDENMRTMDEILGIRKFIDIPVRQLSLGQRMRGDLVAAMLHSPSVLFLDEPTIGLDVDGKYAMRKFVKEMNERKRTTVILTTHDLGDIQELCERLIIINNGKIIEDGPLDALINRIAPYKNLIVEFLDEQYVRHPQATLLSHEGNTATYRFQKDAVTAAKLIHDISAQKTVKDVAIQEAKIEDIIRIAYQAE